VSLGCPKALVDSERIITKLRSEGYAIAPDYAGADVVVVNTCGFLNSAKEESLAAIGEAMAANGRVIVTGCMGVEEGRIRAAHPGVLAVTGPHQYEQVVAAVHDAVPPLHDPFVDLVPPEGIHLTPRHYAYLKISEGCNNRCSFCIIPSLRGDLVSRPAASVLYEAERLVKAGVKDCWSSARTPAPMASMSNMPKANTVAAMFAPNSMILPRNLASLASGCASTTFTPTPMSTKSSRSWPRVKFSLI
jgi:ribosomal protein S12 methylthiotransferase